MSAMADQGYARSFLRCVMFLALDVSFGTGKLQSVAEALARCRVVIQLLFPTTASQQGKPMPFTA